MSALLPLMFAAAAADALVAIVLWRLSSPRESHLRLWSMAFVATGLRHVVFGLFGPIDTARVLFVSVAALGSVWIAVSALLLLAGSYRLRGRAVPRFFWGAAVLAVGSAVVTDLLEVPATLALIPQFVFLAVVDVSTGIVLLRSGPPSLGRRLAAAVFIIWGVHRANFPFLYDHPTIAPWGYSFAIVLGFAVDVALLLVHYEQATERQKESEARFRSFFDNAPDGMFQSTIDGRFLRVNPALVDMLGYRDERELLSVPVSSVYADPAVRAEAMERFADLDVVRNHEVTWRRKDGKPVRVRLNGRRVRGRDGRTLYLEGAVQDVTEAHALQARAREAEKMEALGRLAGGVAHDFNNLLTAILASAELALEDVEPGAPVREELGLVREAAQRAASLTAKLLAFSRRQPARAEPHDLNELLRSSYPLVRRLIDERIEIELDLEEPPLFVEVDPADVQQILLNTAVNARDAMPDGGRIVFRTRRVPGEGEGRARLEVIDSGEGMDEETRQRALEPFFSTKEVGRGTGLGLASVYGVVTRLGGEISLESAPGRGTTVRVDLPLLAASTPDSGAASPSRSVPALGAARTVLLVEDQEMVRRVLQRALERAGFVVLCAPDGRQALSILGERDVELVVTDVVMPGMPGPELLARLRERLPDVPAILMTGYSPESLDGVLADPLNHLLLKPFPPEVLVEEAKGLLERSSTLSLAS